MLVDGPVGDRARFALRCGRERHRTALEGGTQLDELEIAERVLARFGGKASTTEKRRRVSPAKSTPATGEERKARGNQQALGMSLSDATFKAVQAHGEGATASDVLNYLAREFRMTVRPNHLGMALQRHRRAGQLENRNQRWYVLLSA
jgi:hypothetical protein